MGRGSQGVRAEGGESGNLNNNNEERWVAPTMHGVDSEQNEETNGATRVIAKRPEQGHRETEIVQGQPELKPSRCCSSSPLAQAAS